MRKIKRIVITEEDLIFFHKHKKELEEAAGNALMDAVGRSMVREPTPEEIWKSIIKPKWS